MVNAVTSVALSAWMMERLATITYDTFIDIIIEARAITNERMASITKKSREGDRSKMAYFLAVLEDRLSLEQQNGQPS